jgi:hypothetical protein
MSWLQLDERNGVVYAVALLVVCLVMQLFDRRWSRFVAAAAFQLGLVCALFSLWQVANGLTRGHTTGGLQRGRSLWALERTLHLPSEVDVQHLILGHPLVVRTVNYYYDTAHLSVMAVFLVALWLRHRDRFPQVRNALALFTGMSLLVQMVSVAPPRLIGGVGLVDTAAEYGQSVYAVIGSSFADQYAAMPSIHVGWAVLVSVAVVSCETSRWRWLGLSYGALTTFAVVATANHYWADGIVACALLALAWVASRAMEPYRLRLQAALLRRRGRLPQIQQGAFS